MYTYSLLSQKLWLFWELREITILRSVKAKRLTFIQQFQLLLRNDIPRFSSSMGTRHPWHVEWWSGRGVREWGRGASWDGTLPHERGVRGAGGGQRWRRQRTGRGNLKFVCNKIMVSTLSLSLLPPLPPFFIPSLLLFFPTSNLSSLFLYAFSSSLNIPLPLRFVT